MPAVPFTPRAGLLLLMAGAAIDSTTGLFARSISADAFTTAFGRAFSAFLVLAALLLARDRRRCLSIVGTLGRRAWLFALLNGSAMVVTLMSLSHTSVANFFIIFAAAPFLAGAMGWVFLREKFDRATLLTALAGFVGIAIMMFAGATSAGLFGDALAILCVCAYATVVLLARGGQRFDLLPICTVTCLIASLLSLPLADLRDVGWRDAVTMFLFGAIQLATGNLLIFAAAKRITPAQSGLLGVFNAAMAPLWVLAFYGEVPPKATFVGGAIILTAAIAHIYHLMRRSPAFLAEAR